MPEALSLTVIGKKLRLFENGIIPHDGKNNPCTIFAGKIRDAERVNLNRVNTGIFWASPRYCETVIVDHEAATFLSTVHHLIGQVCVVMLPFVSDTAQDIQ